MDPLTRWTMFKAVENIDPERLSDHEYVRETIFSSVGKDALKGNSIDVLSGVDEVESHVNMLMAEFCPGFCDV